MKKTQDTLDIPQYLCHGPRHDLRHAKLFNTILAAHFIMLSLDTKGIVKGNEQHMIHFNYMEEISPKINQPIKYHYKFAPFTI